MAVASFGYGLVLGAGFPTLFTASTQFTILLGIPFLQHLSVVFAVVALLALGKTTVLALGLGTRSEAEVLMRIETSEPTNKARLYARRATSAMLSALILISLLYAAGVL
jgi:hypothetical protein